MTTTKKAPVKKAPVKKTAAVKRAEAEAAVDPDSFAFTGRDGKKYRLPKLDEVAMLEVPGGISADALMYPDDLSKQLALGLHLLALSSPSEKSAAALRALPTRQMLAVLQGWMGKFSGSSD